MKVVVVDACSGNLRSVARSLARVGADVEITRDADTVRRADKLVVPGQGAFDVFMRALDDGRGLGSALREAIARGVPYLGICLGMQVLFEHGDEGDCAGLGLLRGRVTKIAPAGRDKVPHVGWNSVSKRADDPLLAGIGDGAYFYFTHSYRAVPADDVAVLTTEHAGPITAAVRKDNLFACQFHPEKSQSVGLALLQAFAS